MHGLKCVFPAEPGIAFEPLYKAAPGAAMRDPAFYECLAVADALRDGRARQREVRGAGTSSSFPEGKCPIRILINSSPPPCRLTGYSEITILLITDDRRAAPEASDLGRFEPQGFAHVSRGD